jgi:hypothetical protein
LGDASGSCQGKDDDVVVVLGDDFFEVLPDSVVTQAAANGKITKQQIQTVYELYRLQQLTAYSQENEADKDELEKKYRLMVKKRLNKLHAEDLGCCRNKEEKQKLLADLFDERLKHYQAILSSLQRV